MLGRYTRRRRRLIPLALRDSPEEVFGQVLSAIS